MKKKEFYLKACLAFAKEFASPYSSAEECQDNDVFLAACEAASMLTTYADLHWKDMNESNGTICNESVFED